MQQPTSCTTWALKATSFLFARSFHWSHQAPVTSAITSVPLSDQHRPYSGFESCDEAVVGLGKCCGLKVFACGPSSCLSSIHQAIPLCSHCRRHSFFVLTPLYLFCVKHSILLSTIYYLLSPIIFCSSTIYYLRSVFLI